MKQAFFATLLLIASLASAQTLQPKAMRVYRDRDQLIISDSLGNKPDNFSFAGISYGPIGNRIRLTVDGANLYFAPNKFLNKNGIPYNNSSADDALRAFRRLAPSPLMEGNPLRSYESIQRLAQNEGIDYAVGVGTSTVSVAATVTSAVANTLTNQSTVVYTTNQTLATQTVPIGYVHVSSTIEFYFDKKVVGFYYTPFAATGAYTGRKYGTVPLWSNAGETRRRDYFNVTHSKQNPVNAKVTQITDVISGTITPAIGSTTSVPLTYAYNVYGNIITDDLNLSAIRYVDIWGDSIWDGTGPTDTNNMFAFLMREYWTSKGYNYRLRNWSQPGTTLVNHIAYMQGGQYYREPPAVLVIALGANDINASRSAVAIAADYLTLVVKGLALYPNVKIVVPAITPRLNTTFEAANALARAAIKSALTALPQFNTQVFYVEGMGTAWTATDATKYSAGDGANGLHPTDDAEANFGWPVLKTFLDNNPVIFN